jgi:16S rRNA (uracil1498-N3)-methyltransferase
MTRRRFIADTWTPTTASLTGDQAAHLSRVLRASPGQIYDIVANGFLHRAEITSVSEQKVDFTLHEELESAAALPLHLLLSIFKFDHMEWAIEKATELGVARITPILAHRTEKHLSQAALKRAERWRRIAFEAAKQSRRTDIPEIADPLPLKQAIEQEKSSTRILLSETEQATTLTTALVDSVRPTGYESVALTRTGCPIACPKPVEGSGLSDVGFHATSEVSSFVGSSITHAIAIGPEGGWTPEEISLFTQHAWQPVTLGPRILRAETAAIAAIAIASTYLS